MKMGLFLFRSSSYDPSLFLRTKVGAKSVRERRDIEFGTEGERMHFLDKTKKCQIFLVKQEKVCKFALNK